MQVDHGRLLAAIELVAASAWGTEGALRAAERGEVDEAGTLLRDTRRPLLEGLRQLRALLEEQLTDAELGRAETRDTLGAIIRLSELVEHRARRLGTSARFALPAPSPVPAAAPPPVPAATRPPEPAA